MGANRKYATKRPTGVRHACDSPLREGSKQGNPL